MNIVMWLLAGGVVGWVAFAYLDFNRQRGVIVSIVIGAAGGLAGGKIVAPMFSAVAAARGNFSLSTLLFAAAIAAAFLVVANLVNNQWGV